MARGFDGHPLEGRGWPTKPLAIEGVDFEPLANEGEPRPSRRPSKSQDSSKGHLFTLLKHNIILLSLYLSISILST